MENFGDYIERCGLNKYSTTLYAIIYRVWGFNTHLNSHGLGTSNNWIRAKLRKPLEKSCITILKCTLLQKATTLFSTFQSRSFYNSNMLRIFDIEEMANPQIKLKTLFEFMSSIFQLSNILWFFFGNVFLVFVNKLYTKVYIVEKMNKK